MLHCKKFKFEDIWYLEPNELFENRKLYLGTCPQCHKEVAELVEYRKTDNQKFVSTHTEAKLNRLKAIEQYNIIYKYSNYKAPKKVLFQWVFGINQETSIGVKQYACDFYGTRKLLST